MGRPWQSLRRDRGVGRHAEVRLGLAVQPHQRRGGRAGGTDTRELRDRGDLLRKAIGRHNCGIGSPPNAAVLALLVAQHLKGEQFTVKTHGPPTRTLRALIRARTIRPTYVFRDPRDVALSIFDRRTKRRGTSDRPWDNIYSFEDAVAITRRLVPTWRTWSTVPGVHLVRYERLLAEPEQQLKEIVAFLGLDPEKAGMDAALERFPPGRGDADWGDGLHFNVGVAGRFRAALSDVELQLCEQELGATARDMGYPR